MGEPRIGGFAELVEVAAGTEACACAVQHDVANRLVGHRQFQRFAQAVTNACGVGVALVRPVEGDAQGTVPALEQYGGPVRFWTPRAVRPASEPCPELGPVLQGRVRERLGKAGVHVPDPFVVPQEAHQNRGGDGIAIDRVRDHRRLAGTHDHVDDRRDLVIRRR